MRFPLDAACVSAVVGIFGVFGCIGAIAPTEEPARMPSTTTRPDPALRPTIPPAEGALMPAAPPLPPATAIGGVGLRRLTAAEYVASVQDLLGGVSVQGRELDPDNRDGAGGGAFSSVGSMSAFSGEQAVERYSAVAYDVAGQALRNATTRPGLVGCRPASLADPCVDAFIRSFGRRAFRRPLTTDELAESRKVMAAGAAAAGGSDPWLGLEHVVAGLLQDPHFLYVPMLGEPDPAKPGRVRFSSWEMASRLSYTLQGTTPDLELLDAAERGDLVTVEAVRKQALRLIATRRGREAVTRFFSEHFGYDQLEAVPKDAKAFPRWTPALALAMRAELDTTLAEIALDIERSFLDVLDTKRTWLNSMLASHYGVTGPKTSALEATTLPDTASRAGVLTMAGLLSVNAFATRTSPTLRGIFVRKRLLCSQIPPPPENVDQDLEKASAGAPARTKRDQLAAHATQPACAACHAVFDPIGLSLERYDAIGRYRTTDAGMPIDARASLDGVAFDGGLELGAVLRKDRRIARCLVQELLRYAVPIDGLDGAQGAIDDLATKFAAKGHRFRDLLIDLVTSDAFRAAPASPAQESRP